MRAGLCPTHVNFSHEVCMAEMFNPQKCIKIYIGVLTGFSRIIVCLLSGFKCAFFHPHIHNRKHSHRLSRQVPAVGGTSRYISL